MYEKGRLLIAMNAVREPGTNAIEVMEGVKEAVAGLNREVLADRGVPSDTADDRTGGMGKDDRGGCQTR